MRIVDHVLIRHGVLVTEDHGVKFEVLAITCFGLIFDTNTTCRKTSCCYFDAPPLLVFRFHWNLGEVILFEEFIAENSNGLLCPWEEHGIYVDLLTTVIFKVKLNLLFFLMNIFITLIQTSLRQWPFLSDILFHFFCLVNLLLYWWNPKMTSFKGFPENDAHLLIVVKEFSIAAATWRTPPKKVYEIHRCGTDLLEFFD